VTVDRSKRLIWYNCTKGVKKEHILDKYKVRNQSSNSSMHRVLNREQTCNLTNIFTPTYF
jgi:hypothetical protein